MGIKMGHTLQVEWQETADDLKQRYRQEKHVQRRERLLVLWHLRQGKRVEDVVQMTGRGYRLIQRWVSWYRHGGLVEVLQRVTGHGTQGVEAKLSAVQQKALVARVKLGDFATVWEVLDWVKARWGIMYSYEGMRSVLKRNRLGLKVPRPQSEKADRQGQATWQKKDYKLS
jgi:transposase